MRKWIQRGWIPIASLFLALQIVSCRPAAESPASPKPSETLKAREGLALAIVVDTSGSMLDPVANAAGGPEPKYRIARRAADSIFDRLDAYIREAAPGTEREVQAELIVLDKVRARRAIQMRPFQAEVFKAQMGSLPKPNGGTPLGHAIRLASTDLLNAPLLRKHILIVTDGENTEGPSPQDVWPDILKESQAREAGMQLHFVAFDVAAKVFDSVKRLGATVVGASDEMQLKDQLEYILQKKILLEMEERPLK